MKLECKEATFSKDGKETVYTKFYTVVNVNGTPIEIALKVMNTTEKNLLKSAILNEKK